MVLKLNLKIQISRIEISMPTSIRLKGSTRDILVRPEPMFWQLNKFAEGKIIFVKGCLRQIISEQRCSLFGRIGSSHDKFGLLPVLGTSQTWEQTQACEVARKLWSTRIILPANPSGRTFHFIRYLTSHYLPRRSLTLLLS